METKLGDRIRELREQSAVYKSLRQFSAALRKSPSWVSKVERNLEVPSPETLREIARLLGADPAELLALAEKLDPEVERLLALRYAEVHGLLRTLPTLSAEQIADLEKRAQAFGGGSAELPVSRPEPESSAELVPYLSDAEIEAAVEEFVASYKAVTGKSSPPLSPENYVWDWLSDSQRLSLDLEEPLGFDGNGNVIVGNTVATSDSGCIYIDRGAIGSRFFPFTVAHELGHWVLHRPYLLQQSNRTTKGYRPGFITLNRTVEGGRGRIPREEWQANRFAAHVLMPKQLVVPEFRRRFTDRERDYAALSLNPAFRQRHPALRDYTRFLASKAERGQISLDRQFHVSIEAMAIRLEELDLVHK